MVSRLRRTVSNFWQNWPYLVLIAIYKLLEDRFLADVNSWVDSNAGVLEAAIGPALDYWPAITGWGLIPLVIMGILAHSYVDTRPRGFEGALKELADVETDGIRWVTSGDRDWRHGLSIRPQCPKHCVRLLYENRAEAERPAYPYDVIWDEEGFRLLCAQGPHFLTLGEKPQALENVWARAKTLLERELTEMNEAG